MIRISFKKTFLPFSCTFPSTLTMRLTLGVGRRLRACLMLLPCTPLLSSQRPFFVKVLLLFVPQARKFTRSGVHESLPSRV